MGGTKTAGGIVDLTSGQVVVRRVVPTLPTRGGEAVLQATVELAAELMVTGQSSGLELLGVGVAVCELVSPGGEVTSSNAVAWKGLPVHAAFARLVPTVVVESDVRAAALGEALYGAGRPYRSFAYITVGTGISSTLVLGGRPFAGARGNALVMGSSPLSTVCSHCGEPLHPILEEIAAGPALVARYNAARTGSAAAVSSGHEVLALAAQGDTAALGVVTSAATALGVSTGFLVNVLDPEAVIVGGGLGLAGGVYAREFVAATRAHIWSEETRSLPIVEAALGTDAGIVGAAATVRALATDTVMRCPDTRATS